MLNKAAFLAAILLFLTAYAFGVFGDETAPQPQDQPAKAETLTKPGFDQIDENSDDLISMAEAQDTWLSEVFANVDVDQDGFVNRSEYEEALS